jgi:hypothetical protein
MRHNKRYASRVEVHGASEMIFRTHREHAESLVCSGQATDLETRKGLVIRIRLNPFFRLQLERWPKIGDVIRTAQNSSQSTNRARGRNETRWLANAPGKLVREAGRIVGVAREIG